MANLCDDNLNPLMGTLKPQSNGPLYINTVIGTLAVHWLLRWYSDEGPDRAAAPPSPFLAVPNVTAHSSTASVPIHIIRYGTIITVSIKGLIEWCIQSNNTHFVRRSKLFL